MRTADALVPTQIVDAFRPSQASGTMGVRKIVKGKRSVQHFQAPRMMRQAPPSGATGQGPSCSRSLFPEFTGLPVYASEFSKVPSFTPARRLLPPAGTGIRNGKLVVKQGSIGPAEARMGISGRTVLLPIKREIKEEAVTTDELSPETLKRIFEEDVFSERITK